ncbi:VOC family protein [Pseudoalteromonas sp. KG3]|uniref:VOC family protein n=1 Tax=Pseudoalteromonas sp. KG3 TaxID=2951137 RepID=UPI002659E5A9|nr:VOC family protein [Pseudoalteromonas sp. KG3]WKD24375.1 VOC family protein [Pseudoalteromonas sp. KG3]
MVAVYLFTDDYDRLFNFYFNILKFKELDCVLTFPENDNAGIWLLNANGNPSGLSYFGYEIKTNFLSYCESLISVGVKFEMVWGQPSGYVARFFDPDGNTILITSECFDESNEVDTSNWGFFNTIK